MRYTRVNLRVAALLGGLFLCRSVIAVRIRQDDSDAGDLISAE